MTIAEHYEAHFRKLLLQMVPLSWRRFARIKIVQRSNPTSRIGKRIRFGPDLMFGTECEIGSDAMLTRSLFGNRCRIQEGCCITDSVIADDCCVGKQCRIAEADIGTFSYVAEETWISQVTLGKFCSIGPKVIIGYGIHPTNFVSTHPVFYSTSPPGMRCFAEANGFPEREPITIGSDVFIGANAFVRDGVRIGDGAIVGANACVVKDVEPFSIVGGVPARHLRYRFESELIQRMLQSKWWDLDVDELAKLVRTGAAADPKAFLSQLNSESAPQYRPTNE